MGRQQMEGFRWNLYRRTVGGNRQRDNVMKRSSELWRQPVYDKPKQKELRIINKWKDKQTTHTKGGLSSD